MCDFGTRSREEGRNVTEYHFYSLDVEAGDTDRVFGFFNEVKQRRSRLVHVPGWATVVLEFIEDPVSRYNRTLGKMG